MSNDEEQIANTQMFRAFVAKGEEQTKSPARRAVAIGAIVVAIIAAIAVIMLIQN